MEQGAENFLKEKGFDITPEGCKAALEWLEHARPQDAFYSEGPIDNATDWHVGEARLDAMMKIVRGRIKGMEEKE